MMVHAGLAPKWTTQMAEKHAAEVEAQLHGAGYRKLFRNMYGDKPSWAPNLSGYDRSRAIINVLTRMRYCTPRGRIGIEDKGTPGTQEQGLYPWFEVPGRVERDLKIVCGHWSALGLTITQGVHAIDTGAVWGGKLTAIQLDTDELRVVQVPGRDVPAPVPNARPPARPAHERPAASAQGKEQGGGNTPAATPGNRGPRRRRRRGGGAGGGSAGPGSNSPRRRHDAARWGTMDGAAADGGPGQRLPAPSAPAPPTAETPASRHRNRRRLRRRWWQRRAHRSASPPATTLPIRCWPIPAATFRLIAACAPTWWCVPCAARAWTCRRACMKTCAAISVPIRDLGPVTAGPQHRSSPCAEPDALVRTAGLAATDHGRRHRLCGRRHRRLEAQRQRAAARGHRLRPAAGQWHAAGAAQHRARHARREPVVPARHHRALPDAAATAR